MHWIGLRCAGLSKVALGWAKMGLPALHCWSALAGLGWARVGLAGFALLVCAGLGYVGLGGGGTVPGYAGLGYGALRWARVG